MRIRYSFSSRKTGQIEGKNQHRISFPELANKVIDEADIILEVLDSRFIDDTRNMKAEQEIRKRKKILIYIANKADLANIKELKKQLTLLNLYPFVILSCRDRKGKHDLKERIQIEAKKLKKNITGLNKRIQVGIIGYPNTGKSSIINLLVGKNSARVSAESGYTKGIQKVKLFENVLLIDTPGVIPEGENSVIKPHDLVKHAKINVRTYDKVKDPEFVLASLMEKNPNAFEKYYALDAHGDAEVLIEQLGRKKNILKKGNVVDIDRVARLILKDWQEGKINL